jgi:hypothetical protein
MNQRKCCCAINRSTSDLFGRWVHSCDSSRDNVSRAGIPTESRQSCRDSEVMARDVRRILPSILPFWQDTHAPLPGHLSGHFVRMEWNLMRPDQKPVPAQYAAAETIGRGFKPGQA